MQITGSDAKLESSKDASGLEQIDLQDKNFHKLSEFEGLQQQDHTFKDRLRTRPPKPGKKDLHWTNNFTRPYQNVIRWFQLKTLALQGNNREFNRQAILVFKQYLKAAKSNQEQPGHQIIPQTGTTSVQAAAGDEEAPKRPDCRTDLRQSDWKVDWWRTLTLPRR